jgi:hypothetical protein
MVSWWVVSWWVVNRSIQVYSGVLYSANEKKIVLIPDWMDGELIKQNGIWGIMSQEWAVSCEDLMTNEW